MNGLYSYLVRDFLFVCDAVCVPVFFFRELSVCFLCDRGVAGLRVFGSGSWRTPKVTIFDETFTISDISEILTYHVLRGR